MSGNPGSPGGGRQPPWRGRGPRRIGAGDDPVVLTEALGAVVDRLGGGPPGVTGRLFTEWEALVGPALAAHVRPMKVDGPTLVVTVDHPAWATQVRTLAPDILAKVQDAAGPAAPRLTRLEARVRPPS